MKRIKIFHKGKSIEIKVKEMKGLNKAIGLMFQGRKKAQALLFEFKKPVKIYIHSWFVFFPFIGIWLNENNKIIRIKRISSFKEGIYPGKKFTKLIEIPVNKKYLDVLRLLVED